MRSRRLLLLVAVLSVALASTLAWSRSKPDPCPGRAVRNGSPCKQEHATCRWACEHESQRDLSCTCEKNDTGQWRWHCQAVGQVCRK